MAIKEQEIASEQKKRESELISEYQVGVSTLTTPNFVYSVLLTLVSNWRTFIQAGHWEVKQQRAKN